MWLPMALCVREGSKREQCHLLGSGSALSHSPPLPTCKLGPSDADSRVGGSVDALEPYGPLTNSPVGLGVSPAVTSTPTVVFSQRL